MSTPERTEAVGYILKKFPVLSETFILNEILALEARGIPVHIFSLERPNDPRFHEDLPRLKAPVYYVPDAFDLKVLLRQNELAAKRYGHQYRSAATYTVARARPTLFWRFLQACYIANQAWRLHLSHFHAHFATRPTSVAFLASRITGLPYSFTAHAMDIFKENLSRRALAQKLEQAKFVVTVSDYNQSYLKAVANGGAEKIARIYNGIDLTRFSPTGNTSPDPFTILCVARLVEKKGHSVLIDACRQLRDREVAFRCWIVGRGKLRSQLDSMVRRCHLQGHVEFLGPHTQMEVLERYRSSHLFVLPCTTGSDGNRDGLPVALVEALACGLPVVTTPMTGIPEVVKHQWNGLLVPEGDARSLADAIESMAYDRDLYKRLRANARPSVATDFDINRTSETLHHLLVEA